LLCAVLHLQPAARDGDDRLIEAAARANLREQIAECRLRRSVRGDRNWRPW
jgi:hypothetical protein